MPRLRSGRQAVEAADSVGLRQLLHQSLQLSELRFQCLDPGEELRLEVSGRLYRLNGEHR